MPQIFKWALIVAAALFAAWIIDRLLLAAERKGWIYWRKKKGSPDAVGNAILELQSMLEPSKKNILEERLSEKSEENENGDPPMT